jgi:hypothetical protein
MVRRDVCGSPGNPRNEKIRGKMGSSRCILVLKLLRSKRSAWGVLKTRIYCSVSIIGRVPMAGIGSSIRIICVIILVPVCSIYSMGLCVWCVCVMGVGASICIVGLVSRFCIAQPMGIMGCERLACYFFEDLVLIVSQSIESASPDKVTI